MLVSLITISNGIFQQIAVVIMLYNSSKISWVA